MGLSLPSHCGPNPGIYSWEVRPHREERFASVTRRGTGGGGRCGARNARTASAAQVAWLWRACPRTTWLPLAAAPDVVRTSAGVVWGPSAVDINGQSTGGHAEQAYKHRARDAGRNRQILRRLPPVCITNKRTQGCGVFRPRRSARPRIGGDICGTARARKARRGNDAG